MVRERYHGQQVAEGDYAGAAGTAVGTIAQAAVPEMRRAAPAAANTVKGAITAPGTAEMVKGAGWATGGVVAGMEGHPLYGLAAGLKGLGDIMGGVSKRRAAAAKAMAEAAENAPAAPPPNQFFGPRNPAWKDLPEPAQSTAAPAPPIPSQLPSGRVPGKGQPSPVQPAPARPAPAWLNNPVPNISAPEPVAPIAGGLPSGRTPGGISRQAPPSAAPASQSNEPLTLNAPEQPNPSAPEQQHREAMATDLAKVLHSGGNGIPSTQLLEFMADAEPAEKKAFWSQAAAGVDALRGAPPGAVRAKPPSPATIEATIQQLRDLERIQQVKIELRNAMTPETVQ